MNVYLARELSLYQLALDVQVPLQSLSLSPAALLSFMRSQIDLLIEQQIAATLWVKLPPGKIWHSEIQRYSQQLGASAIIYTCYASQELDNPSTGAGESKSNKSPRSNKKSENRKLPREYFLMILSPRFCSLTVATKPSKLRAISVSTSFEARGLQQVLDGIRRSILPVTSPLPNTDFIGPPVETGETVSILSQLLAKQLQQQNDTNSQINNERITRLQQQNQKLHNTVQLKDDFLSNVCQELRIPLTHMKTALSLLNSSSLKPPQRQRYLQMLNMQCDRQNSLISGALELAQMERNLEQMALESVRLEDVVPGVVSIYQPLAQERGIMLAYTVPTGLPAVWCVSGGLRQILIHLLSNSIKFTPKGGQVWVRGRLQGNHVFLDVRDTGIGISESDIPKIFDRFYRVRVGHTSSPSGTVEDPSGAGLGLTIVKQLLWRCGGSVSVKSKLNQGSTFTVQMVSVCEPPK